MLRCRGWAGTSWALRAAGKSELKGAVAAGEESRRPRPSVSRLNVTVLGCGGMLRGWRARGAFTGGGLVQSAPFRVCCPLAEVGKQPAISAFPSLATNNSSNRNGWVVGCRTTPADFCCWKCCRWTSGANLCGWERREGCPAETESSSSVVSSGLVRKWGGGGGGRGLGLLLRERSPRRESELKEWCFGHVRSRGPEWTRDGKSQLAGRAACLVFGLGGVRREIETEALEDRRVDVRSGHARGGPVSTRTHEGAKPPIIVGRSRVGKAPRAPPAEWVLLRWIVPSWASCACGEPRRAVRGREEGEVKATFRPKHGVSSFVDCFLGNKENLSCALSSPDERALAASTSMGSECPRDTVSLGLESRILKPNFDSTYVTISRRASSNVRNSNVPPVLKEPMPQDPRA